MPDKLKKGWKVWRFDQMATMVNERIDDPAKAGVEHYVGLEHLDPESLTIRRWGTPSDVAATKLLFRKGDIIFGRRRVYQRKLAVAHFDGICSAHAMVLRAKPDVVLSEFLPFFMQSDLFMERAKQISVGSLSPTINWKTLAQEEFALPPLDEQRRIAEVLGHFEEMERMKQLVEEAVEEIFEEKGTQIPYLVGTMIELPRACLVADQLAEAASFFSFGTNDLTQTTLGYSRDDSEGKFLPFYLQQKILKTNPFAEIDVEGVGRLVEMAIEKGRQARPDLKLGICGEHGGDPASIHFFHAAGLDYVSCSPFRIPIARLSAARAVISEKDHK